MTRLDDHVEALRELGDEGDGGAATRLRVRRSLEQGHHIRTRPGLLVALAVLLVASASWGFATGTIQRLFRPASSEAVPEAGRQPAIAEQRPVPPADQTPAEQPAPAPQPAPAEQPVPAPAKPPDPTMPVAAAAAPRADVTRPTTVSRVRVSTERATEQAPAPSALYARAHELYFHGSDDSAALAAWDAYLAAEPNGQLVVEATYNRALCLVRLGRLADARTALLPFARGEVAPAGYRRAEAKALIERIDRRTNSLNGTRGCGDDPACE